MDYWQPPYIHDPRACPISVTWSAFRYDFPFSLQYHKREDVHLYLIITHVQKHVLLLESCISFLFSILFNTCSLFSLFLSLRNWHPFFPYVPSIIFCINILFWTQPVKFIHQDYLRSKVILLTYMGFLLDILRVPILCSILCSLWLFLLVWSGIWQTSRWLVSPCTFVHSVSGKPTGFTFLSSFSLYIEVINVLLYLYLYC